MKAIKILCLTILASISLHASASVAPACPANQQAVCETNSAIPACHDTNNKATTSEPSCPTGTIPACKALGPMTVAVCKSLK